LLLASEFPPVQGGGHFWASRTSDIMVVVGMGTYVGDPPPLYREGGIFVVLGRAFGQELLGFGLKVWVFIHNSRKEDRMTHLNPHCPICDEGGDREALHAVCWRCINSENRQQTSNASKCQAKTNDQVVSDQESVFPGSVVNSFVSWFGDLVAFVRVWRSFSVNAHKS
jgi:hypothetical protein